MYVCVGVAAQTRHAVRHAGLPAAGDDRGQAARREGRSVESRRALLRVSLRQAALRS